MGSGPQNMKRSGSDNLKGAAMVFVAVVLGLLLSVSILWYETQQKEATAVASAAAQPATTSTVSSSPTTAPAEASGAKSPAAPTASNSAGGAASVSSGSIEAGKKDFDATCNSCHPNAEAGVGPSLKGVSAAKINQMVRNGKDIMPAFSTSQVSDQELKDIVAYLTSLK